MPVHLGPDRSPELRLEASDTPPPGWDRAIAKDGPTVFHCAAWADFKRSEGGGDPFFCTWSAPDGDVLGRALAIRRPGRSTRLGRLVARVVFDAPPVGVAGLEPIPALQRWARGERTLLDVRLGSFDARAEWSSEALPSPVPRLEVERGLLADEDALRASLDQRMRYNVRRAERNGVHAAESRVDADVGRFVALAVETLRDLERRKGISQPKVDQLSLTAGLVGLIRAGRGRLWLAGKGDTASAGVFFGVCDSAAYYLYSGADDKARELLALPAAMYAALRDLGAGGVERANLGGVEADAADSSSRDHGLLRFKRGFGGRDVPRRGGSLVVRPVRARALAALESAVRR